MSEDDQKEEPRFIDPNSGAAPQPGGFVASVLPQETAGEDAGAARPDNDPQAAEREAGEDAGNTPDMQGAAGADGADSTEDEQPQGETEGGDEEEQPEAEAKDYSSVLSGGVKDVQKYLEAHPEEKDAVIAAEKQGKNRSTIVEG